jgi:predicted lipoprotein with Yx(FWY)xxD motif
MAISRPPVHNQLTRRASLLVGLAAAAVLAAACGSSGSGSSGGSSAPASGAAGAPPSAAPTARPAAMTTHSTKLGAVVAGPDGRTVYVFEADKSTSSSCYGACAANWPAVMTTGDPIATGAAKSTLLGTTQRKDGSTQVTYAGRPVYYFVGDKSEADVRGQGLNAFGGSWYVISPDGNKIDNS